MAEKPSHTAARTGRSSTGKVIGRAADAVGDIASGASLAVGGFGLAGVPSTLIEALAQTTAEGLHIVSNNCGTDGSGLGVFLEQHRVARVVASYIGYNKEFARQYLAGEVEVELVPQGTLAERLRSGGMGIPAFFTPAGVGTPVGDGGLPWRYDTEGQVVVASGRKEHREFDLDGRGPRTYLLEHAIVTDFALVRAWKGDSTGNLVYRGASQNFNPLCAMAARVAIAEVEHLVEPGELEPADVHTPGIFVDRVVRVAPEDVKRIEIHTTRGVRPNTSEVTEGAS